ncbi:hypothetical protein R6Q59_022096 [Mikania micrantha]
MVHVVYRESQGNLPFKINGFSLTCLAREGIIVLSTSLLRELDPPSAMGELDPTFIQEPEHRPKPALIEAHGIPQIDLSPYITSSSSPNAIHDLVDEIRDACKDWGFFQVINHGVPIEICEKLQSVVKRFFDQSLEEKKKVKRDEANPLGYYDTKHTKNVRDWKEVFDFMVDDPVVMPASYDEDDDGKRKDDNALTC